MHIAAYVCFDLDGSVQAKANMCSCKECLLGNLISCGGENGYIVIAIKNDTSHNDSDRNIEYEIDNFCEEPEFDS